MILDLHIGLILWNDSYQITLELDNYSTKLESHPRRHFLSSSIGYLNNQTTSQKVTFLRLDSELTVPRTTMTECSDGAESPHSKSRLPLPSDMNTNCILPINSIKTWVTLPFTVTAVPTGMMPSFISDIFVSCP